MRTVEERCRWNGTLPPPGLWPRSLPVKVCYRQQYSSAGGSFQGKGDGCLFRFPLHPWSYCRNIPREMRGRRAYDPEDNRQKKIQRFVGFAWSLWVHCLITIWMLEALLMAAMPTSLSFCNKLLCNSLLVSTSLLESHYWTAFSWKLRTCPCNDSKEISQVLLFFQGSAIVRLEGLYETGLFRFKSGADCIYLAF